MSIEIDYRSGNAIYLHDDVQYSLKDLVEHIRNNGHEREIPSVIAPNYNLMKKAIKKKEAIMRIFDEKEGRHLDHIAD